MRDQDKKRFYPLRDTDNPDKVVLVPINEDLYREVYREIWAVRKRRQSHGECICPKRYLWKCDANCDLCKYYKPKDLSLNTEIDDDLLGESVINGLDSSSIEEIITDRLLLEMLFDRLHELSPDAKAIIELWLEDPDISDRAIARVLGIPQRTFAVRMKKIRSELRNLLN